MIRKYRMASYTYFKQAKISPEDAAAIKIQACFRGLIARKEYLKRLIQKIEEVKVTKHRKNFIAEILD